MKIVLLIITIFAIFLPLLCSSAQPLDIIINEIAWMGTSVSYNDEWVELYNQADSDINLSGWKLIAKDGIPEIMLNGEINAKSFFLLERTDDNSVANITADQVYTGALSNQGEFLQLIDNQANIIDEIDCPGNWPAGDNQTKQTMERTGSNWQTSQSPEGTPRAPNSKGAKPESIQEAIEIRSPEEIGSLKANYPDGIVINEILPSPEGPDAENEYFEIFNQNDFGVNLSKWFIEDVKGATKTFIFPAETIIKAKGFSVFFSAQTKITLNNSEDGLKLFKPNKELADEINYNKAPLGESFNRDDKTGDDWLWSSNLTPGIQNIFVGPASENSKDLESATSANTSTNTSTNIESFTKQESAIGLATEKTKQNFSSVLLTAAPIALLSGASALFLKRKLKLRNPA